MLCGVANADTCVRTNFTVTYSCGAGTLADGQTLPTPSIAEYGTTFTPTSNMKTTCTPPTGYIWSGHNINVDGTEVAYSWYLQSFRYNYLTDIEITPRFVPEYATLENAMITYYGGNSTALLASAFDTSNGTWEATFWNGKITGESKCSSVEPENKGPYVSFIPTNQAEIESGSKTYSGGECYCKLTSPYLEKNPWVRLHYAYGCTLAKCTEECHKYLISNYGLSDSLRMALFSAVEEYRANLVTGE